MNVKQNALRMMRKKSDEGGKIVRYTEGEGGGGEGDEEGEGKEVKEERKQKEKGKWKRRGEEI